VTDEAIRQRLAVLVSEATDGEITAAEAVAAPSLALLGVNSLATLRLIDAVETEFGVALDLVDAVVFDSVAGLADCLASPP
jgi:acyl carrier protein